MSVMALRWFGGGKCLVVDEATGETFTAARVVPGERVTLRRYQRGGRRVPVADEVMDASPHRRAPSCARYDRCTGCDLLHVSEAEEGRYKQLTVREVLERFAGVTVDAVELVGGVQRGDHRVRARFAVHTEDDGVVLGLRSFDGSVSDTAACVANTPRVRDALLSLREIFNDGAADLPAYVEVVEGADGVAAVLEAETTPTDALIDAVAELPTLTAVASRVDGELTVHRGAWPRQHQVGELALEAGPDAWVQPTPDRAAALYAWVVGLGYHVGASILDATCGTGGLSLTLAANARSVLGVDANWAAVRSAVESAQAHGASHVAFRGGKIETVAPRLQADGASFDFTIVNPMRRSLGGDAMRSLAALTERRFLYLAPAPRAGAEDVGVLRDEGFAVKRVAAVNLHPGTAKVMMAVAMERA